MRSSAVVVSLLLLLAAPLAAHARDDWFDSTFRDPVDGDTIAELSNYHIVSTEGELPGMVVRGSTPMRNFMNPKDELPLVMERVKPTHVLIFKNSTSGGDVDREVQQLTAQYGFQEGRLGSPRRPREYLQIPFKWRKMGPFQESCEQLIDALRFIRRGAGDAKGRVLTHCTAGEDRTGLLVGIYRLLFQKDRYNLRQVYRGQVAGLANPTDPGEMCSRGFAYGNTSPDKIEPQSADPQNRSIAEIVQQELGPLLVRFAFLIDQNLLTVQNLDTAAAQLCARDPATDPEWRVLFEADPKYDWKRDEYRCDLPL
jgi:hypothetical protein